MMPPMSRCAIWRSPTRAEAVIGSVTLRPTRCSAPAWLWLPGIRGIRRGITLQNLLVHDVNGNVCDKHMNNGGIYMTALRPPEQGRHRRRRAFGDILVEGCYVAHVSRWGIAVGYTYAHACSFRVPALDEKPFAALWAWGIVIRDNYVKAAGGDGITVMYALRPLVEHNTADSVACEMNDRISASRATVWARWPQPSGRGSARTRCSAITKPLTPASIRTAWPTMRTPATARCTKHNYSPHERGRLRDILPAGRPLQHLPPQYQL